MPIATATLSKLCARSITVDGELDVERGELVGELGREAEIGDDLLFHDVDDEARPFLEFRPVALHDVGDAELDQRVDRDVDRHPQVDAELREIEAGLERLRSDRSASVSGPIPTRPAMKAPGISTPSCG